MKVSVYNQQRDVVLSSSLIKRQSRALLEKLSITCDEIAIYYVSSKKITALHGRFFDDFSPTDCLTLPMDLPGEKMMYCFLGEIFISPEIGRQYAENKKISLYEELTLYLIHGILHLIGYEDGEPRKREKMRRKERVLMRYLKSLDLISSSSEKAKA